MKMWFMWRTDVMAEIEYDLITREVQVINYTDIIVKRPFGVREKPSFEDFEEFLETRCFPKSRGNCKQLLKDLGLEMVGYDPYSIVRVTHGRQLEDYGWIKFEGEDIDYEKDIKLRD